MREYAADLYPARGSTPVDRGPSPYLILAVLTLSAVALFGGELVGTVISGDQLGGTTPIAPSAAPVSTTDASEPPASQAGDTDGGDAGEDEDGPLPAPRLFSDGFTLLIRACASEPIGPTCDATAFVGETVWVLLSFENGEPSDRIAATVLAGGDDPVGGGEIELGELGCEAPCRGWTYFRLADLAPGNYRVNVSRNGEPGGTTTFAVEAEAT